MIGEELVKATTFSGYKIEEFTVAEFEKDFDALFSRVEKGETFIIVHPDGYKVYITPLDHD